MNHAAHQLRISLPAIFAITALSLLCARPARAQDFNGQSDNRPKLLDDVGIDEKLGQTVPGDLMFKDESGNDVSLSDIYAHDKPVILTLVYFKCPRLCTMVLNDLVAALNVIPLSAQKDFQVIAVSFDPSETPPLAAAKKASYMRAYKKPGAASGWHFLTGNQDNIKKIANAVGFRYVWDDKQQQFVHASAVMVLSPKGVVSHYIYGLQYIPNDLRLSIDAAAAGQQLSTTERIFCYCFEYDPATGKWTFAILRALKVGGALTILAVGGLVAVLIRHDRHKLKLSEEAI